MWKIILLLSFFRLCSLVETCVLEYFKTFVICWNLILKYFSKMILKYIDFLKILVIRMTSYPFCIFGTISIFISLFFVYKIISIL
jgi:hypothetical protein